MRRRGFLTKSLLGFFILPSFLLRAEFKKNSLSGQVFKSKKAFTSKMYPNKKYKSAKDFWSDHPDEVSDRLKSKFAQDKFLISSHSRILADGRTVVIEKVFHSEEAYFKFKSLQSHLKYQKSENVNCQNLT